jgi:hypothetical protein
VEEEEEVAEEGEVEDQVVEDSGPVLCGIRSVVESRPAKVLASFRRELMWSLCLSTTVTERTIQEQSESGGEKEEKKEGEKGEERGEERRRENEHFS